MFAVTLGSESAPPPVRCDHFCGQLTALCALVLAVGGPALAQSVAGHVSFDVTLPQDAGAMGHAWAVVTPTEGPQKNIDLAYGLYPAQKTIFNRDSTPPGARGAINNDASTWW